MAGNSNEKRWNVVNVALEWTEWTSHRCPCGISLNGYHKIDSVVMEIMLFPRL